MSFNLLDHFLLSQLWAFLLVFARVGAAIMTLPGFGETYVTPRFRLLFAVAFSVLLTPLLAGKLPAMPENNVALGMLLVGEILIGGFIGVIARAVLSALHVCGLIIAQQSSLATASIFDPGSGAQSPVVSNLLSIAAITLFFVLNLHFLVLAALVQSYDVFVAGAFPSVGDMNLLHARVMADAFTLGVLLAGPHIVFSLIFYLMGGLLTRLMPNFQIFFVLMSPQILIAFFLLMAIMPVILGTHMEFMQTQFSDFIAGGG